MMRFCQFRSLQSCLSLLLMLSVAAAIGGRNSLGGEEGLSTASHPVPEAILWHTDYGTAVAAAKEQKSFVLLWFVDPGKSDENEKWEASVLNDPRIRERLAKIVAVRLPQDAKVPTGEKGEQQTALLEHPAFAELLRQPGVALLDLRDEASPHFHFVVSVYPFGRGPLSSDGLIAMLDLPTGSLTQRTLIWAIRTHGEQPQSARGAPNSILAMETESHARLQADLNLQGHHHWEARFQSINARLGEGMVSREVCAESWPGQHLVDAAEECVHSWRQSSGHWEAVSGSHECFGFDMKLGTGGVWYAVGIFGDRR